MYVVLEKQEKYQCFSIEKKKKKKSITMHLEL